MPAWSRRQTLTAANASWNSPRNGKYKSLVDDRRDEIEQPSTLGNAKYQFRGVITNRAGYHFVGVFASEAKQSRDLCAQRRDCFVATLLAKTLKFELIHYHKLGGLSLALIMVYVCPWCVSAHRGA